ncbi:Glucan endo-1,3-beta-glucosidase [Cardamine amara subsp. amara]|uniref:glucan endo-1,3-beta-D-glucosidase n=1 Tax=Cardamine amara subsp. amara TaxID=228776 RepID=A0ABD0ZVV5_CARAN
MFDSQPDTVCSAIDKLGSSNVEIGWPSEGDRDQISVDVATADEFDKNVVARVTTGTPLMSNRTFRTYFSSCSKKISSHNPHFGLFRLI